MDNPPRGFIFDLDGTVYIGERALPGAVETIARIRARGGKTIFISNNPLEPASAYAEKLSRLGIPATPRDVVTSVDVLVAYLLKNAPRACVFVIGEPPLINEVHRAGFKVSEEPNQIEYVIAAFDRTFDYRKWNIAFQAIKFHGARFIATNADKSCPVDGGEIPDCRRDYCRAGSNDGPALRVCRRQTITADDRCRCCTYGRAGKRMSRDW